MARVMLYNLIEKEGKVSLNIGLTSHLVDFYNHSSLTLEIDLPIGKVSLKKYDYLNTGKAHEAGKLFFIVATKSFSPKQVKRILLQYACDKIDSRLEHLQTLKSNYQKLLVA